MEEGGSVTVLVDAKEEYTKQLISILKPCIYQGIKSIYLDSKDIANQENTLENVLMIFQDQLSRIPKWSQEIITKEYQRIIDSSRCDYIEDLLKVVYVSHIKILTVVHSAQRNKKITAKVPSGNHFMHLCYIECAREFWKNPYLFSDRTSKYEHQKNMRDSESMISECISETIRKQLPVRNILKEYLNDTEDDGGNGGNCGNGGNGGNGNDYKTDEDAVDEDDIKNPINQKYLKRLETMVKKELAHLANDKKLESKEALTNAATAASSTDMETPQQQLKDTIKTLDIDVIRRIIKEEMDSRLREGTAPSPSAVIPKKETVAEVVEKIIEKVEEQITAVSASNPDTTSTSDSTHLTIITDVDTNLPPPSYATLSEIDQKPTKCETPAILLVETKAENASTGGVSTTKSLLKISDVEDLDLDLTELDNEIPNEQSNAIEAIETDTSATAAATDAASDTVTSVTGDDELITTTLDDLNDLEELDLKTVSITPDEKKENSNSSSGFSFFKDAVKSMF